MPAQTPALDFAAHVTQQRWAGAEFRWSGMVQTQQHAEIPSDECVRKHADKAVLLHNPVVAD